ncbi:MAG: CBS domain-containing protein [Anaerolineaceae bacterium]|nr:CBS domain-containing protein [Anaerolineaceae bacterium]
MNSSGQENKKVIIDDQVAEQITRVEELSYELKISDVMSRKLRTLTTDMKMKDALELMRQQRISGAPVLYEGQLVGVLSMEDLIHCLCNSDLDASVKTYMTPNPITVLSNAPVVEALKTFVSSHVGRLPVLSSDGELIGMLTKGDITRGVLGALKRDYASEELKRYRASHLFEDIKSDKSSLVLRYNIDPKDFTKGGAASSNIKRALLRLGASPQLARQCGIAAYEAEMNLIIHTNNGGILRVEIQPHQISMVAYDDGPGIADVELAMKPGYSTATDETRELGFGAGMGLPNIARCVDSVILESSDEKGTRLKMKIFLESDEGFGDRRSA